MLRPLTNERNNSGVVAFACTYLNVLPVQNFVQQHACARNNMPQGVQTEPTKFRPFAWAFRTNASIFVSVRKHTTFDLRKWQLEHISAK